MSEQLPLDALNLPPDEIAARFRSARRRGRPEWLWPDVPMRAWRCALQAIEAAVTAALVTEDGRGVRLVWPSPDYASDADPALVFAVAAYTSGMGPLLGYWLETGRLEANREVAAMADLHLRHGRRRARRGRMLLTETVGVLLDAGVRPVILKGAHTSHVYFPEPGVRPSTDIDLLVSPRQADTAERALRAAGYGASYRQPRLGRSTWLPPGDSGELRSLRLVHTEDPYTVDLHTSLDRHFGVRMVGLGPLTERAERSWRAVHPSGRALAHPYRTAYLALHISNGLRAATLLRLVELVYVVRADLGGDEARWAELHDLLTRAHALRFVYPAFELAEQLVPGTLDSTLREAVGRAATPRMRRLIDRLGPAGVQRIGELSLSERFMWATGPVEHVRRALHLLWPAWIESPKVLVREYTTWLRGVIAGRVGWRRGADDA